ncbi:MAG: hypothetical protein AVDCRST_MAG41-777 [uncultured Corynebacteriales bacterium]|uniref:ScyD/ScyE family protein n=1 Tax=uncultured Mycobacteriales bacterium TaxID=581187 RepID=A0A6J4HMU9_9ACTN|nr:MAG: hypothetical protein AVDCRST_MAG41-777 [uncultured Corynebacteriales bacterium]
MQLSRRRLRQTALAGAAAGAVAMSLVLPATAAAAPAPAGASETRTAGTLEVVRTGLNNARKVTWDPRLDVVYVAEAGRSSATCIGDTTNGCFSRSGSIYGYSPHYDLSSRVVTGLPTLRTARGLTGLAEVNPYGATEVRAVFGLGGTSALREQFDPAAAPLGQLARIQVTGQVIPSADLVAFEEQNNPDGRIVDTNPYGVETDATGSVVADAAANAILHVTPAGAVSVLAVPPGVPLGPREVEPVPTSVVRGPDGYYYFGELLGAPFPPGLARVWKVRPGEQATLVSAGFTNITDLAFDRQGRLLVLEMAERGLLSGDPTGRLVRLEADGTQTVLAREGLSLPGGMAVTPNGDIYISNKITSADGGSELLRLRGAA